MLRRTPLIMLILLVVVFSFSISPAVSQNTELRWSSPKLLGDGWWQQITRDMQGGIHMSWFDGYDDGSKLSHDTLTYDYLPLNGEWESPRDVIYTTDGGYTVRNALAVTTDGILHAVFRAKTEHYVSSAPASAAMIPQNWTPWVQVDASGYYVNMIADRKDILHLVFSGVTDATGPIGGGSPEASLCPYCQDLFYRRSVDGGKTWAEPVPLSIDANTGADRMDIFEGQSGRIYIDWDEGLDWNVGKGQAQDVRIVYSDDNGLTWSKPIILDGGNLPGRRPIQIVAIELRDGSLLAVWRFASDIDRGVYYQVSSDVGKTWTTPERIPGIVGRSMNDTPLDDYNMVIDRLGAVHLFAVGQPNEITKANASLYDIVYQQGVWSPPQRVFYAPNLLPEWPKAVVGLQNDIHLSWFVRGIREDLPREQQSTTDILRVYYSHLAGNLPLQATGVYRPTETPLPTPTVFQNIEPSNTPFPTYDDYEQNFYVASQDTYAANVLIAGVLASAGFCALIAIVIRFLRR